MPITAKTNVFYLNIGTFFSVPLCHLSHLVWLKRCLNSGGTNISTALLNIKSSSVV